jgi:hypothetical protein
MSIATGAVPRWRTIYNWVNFWSRLAPAPLLTPVQHEVISEQLRTMDPGSRRFLIDAWKRQNDQLSKDLDSVRARGTALLTATGVISGVLALLVPVAAAIHGGVSPATRFSLVLLGLAAGAFGLTIYCAVATAVLGMRSQEVDFWGQNEMHPGTRGSPIGYELQYAFSLYVTYTDNLSRLGNPVGYLRQAQAYFRLLVMALAALVILAGLALFVGALSPPKASAVAPHQSPTPSAIASATRTGH